MPLQERVEFFDSELPFCHAPQYQPNPEGLPHLNPNPVKIAAAIHMAGAYNLKKVLPRHVLQRRQPPQINLPAGTLSEAGTWLLERTQTLWDDGMPDEASALYSEFSRGPALSE